MLFSSIPFLYYFLPLVLAVYFLTPARFRNAVLLLASLIFYAWGEPKYVLLMLASILSGYGFGLLQERYRGQKGAKLVCGLSVAVSLSFLLYFKYADFFLENFNAATGLGVPLHSSPSWLAIRIFFPNPMRKRRTPSAARAVEWERCSNCCAMSE